MHGLTVRVNSSNGSLTNYMNFTEIPPLICLFFLTVYDNLWYNISLHFKTNLPLNIASRFCNHIRTQQPDTDASKVLPRGPY